MFLHPSHVAAPVLRPLGGLDAGQRIDVSDGAPHARRIPKARAGQLGVEAAALIAKRPGILCPKVGRRIKYAAQNDADR
jgi:hypothetical protein